MTDGPTLSAGVLRSEHTHLRVRPMHRLTEIPKDSFFGNPRSSPGPLVKVRNSILVLTACPALTGICSRLCSPRSHQLGVVSIVSVSPALRPTTISSSAPGLTPLIRAPIGIAAIAIPAVINLFIAIRQRLVVHIVGQPQIQFNRQFDSYAFC